MTPSPLRPGDSHHEQDVAQRALYGASWDRAQSVGRREGYAATCEARPCPATGDPGASAQRPAYVRNGCRRDAALPSCRPDDLHSHALFEAYKADDVRHLPQPPVVTTTTVMTIIDPVATLVAPAQ